MKVWSLSEYARGAVSTGSYQLRKQKMRLVAVVASKSNMSYATPAEKLVWLGAVISIAMITLFTMAKSLWTGKGNAVIGTVSTQNTSNKRKARHLG
jgi:hypothetical protein